MSELGKYEEGRLIIPEGFFGSVDDEASVVVIEDFIKEEDLDQAYEYALVANMEYPGGRVGKLKDRVHESAKFETDNPELYQIFKEDYFIQVKAILEEKHGLELSDAFRCSGIHKVDIKNQDDKMNYSDISSRCGCASEIKPYITAWKETDDQLEHKDNDEFTAIIYLNDNYEGGELNFPSLDMSIKPTKGSLIFWPGYLTHSVSPVTSGIRYTMPMFLKAIATITK